LGLQRHLLLLKLDLLLRHLLAGARRICHME